MSGDRATPRPRRQRSLQLDPYTLAWLAKPHHEHARKIVTSVWDALDERDRAGGDTTSWRQLLLNHQPALFRGRCTGCRPRSHFPCHVWHRAQINLGLVRGWSSL